MTLMQRRRALMEQIGGGANMIPGKEITIETNMTNGGQIQSAVSAALTAANVASPCVIFTQKARSTWVGTEFVAAIVKNDYVVGTSYRYNKGSGNIDEIPMGSPYDFKCAAGTKFYVIEVSP